MNESLVNQTDALTAGGMLNQIINFFEQGGFVYGDHPSCWGLDLQSALKILN